MPSTVSARVISDREFALQQTFRAPAARVFAAYTDPAIVPRWWSSRGGTVRVETMDVRPGGDWRIVQRTPDGRETVFAGKYLEVRPVTRLVYTFRVEGQPGSELTATVDLRESGGTTVLTLTNRVASPEARDAMIRYGAAAGAKLAWDRLAEVLAEAGP